MSHSDDSIAIVGGGIAGLFCAYVLGQRGKKVTLFEATGRLGGRIRTIRLNKYAEEMNPQQLSREALEFYVEFGPMRIELDKQPLLAAC